MRTSQNKLGGKRSYRALGAVALFFPISAILWYSSPFANGLNASSPIIQTSELSNDDSSGCVVVKRPCKTIIDASCRTRMNPESYFHRIVDCLIPEYQFLKRNLAGGKTHDNTTCLFGQGSRYDFFNAINENNTFPSSPNALEIPFRERVKCITLVEDQVVIQQGLPHKYKMSDLVKADLLALQTNTLALMSDVRKSFARNSTQKIEVLLVARRGTRNFEAESEKAIIDYIEGLHENLVLSVYSGLENVTQTIKMFYSANVVIMYHGAAAANIVFCEDNTAILEISCYADLAGAKKWRSNAPIIRALKPNVTFGVFYLPLQVAHPTVNVTLLDAVDNADKFIKGLNGIHVGASQLDMIGNFIKKSDVFDGNATHLNTSVIEVE